MTAMGGLVGGAFQVAVLVPLQLSLMQETFRLKKQRFGPVVGVACYDVRSSFCARLL